MPEVSFTKEYVLEVVEDNSGAVTGSVFTTVPRYTEENFNSLVPPYFSYYTEDENNDDIPEKFVFDIIIHGITAANIRNVYLAMGFMYELDGVTEEIMRGLAMFQIDSPNGLGDVRAYGSLVLKQRDPIEDSYQQGVEYDVNPLEKMLNGSLTEMSTTYRERKAYTEFEGKIITMPYGGSNQVKIHIEMLIPENQEIKYNPAELESLKTAWIQYIYVLIPIYYVLILYVLRFILSNQIIETHISNNLPKPKDKRWWKKFREFETRKF